MGYYSAMKIIKYQYILQMDEPSLQFSRSVVSDSSRPRESEHARPLCPSLTPRVHPNSCPSSWWCHPAISSSVVPFSSCLQSYKAELEEGTDFPTVLPPPRPLRSGPLLPLCNELNAAQAQRLTHSPPLTSMNARSELVRSTMAVELAGKEGTVKALPMDNEERVFKLSYTALITVIGTFTLVDD